MPQQNETKWSWAYIAERVRAFFNAIGQGIKAAVNALRPGTFEMSTETPPRPRDSQGSAPLTPPEQPVITRTASQPRPPTPPTLATHPAPTVPPTPATHPAPIVAPIPADTVLWPTIAAQSTPVALPEATVKKIYDEVQNMKEVAGFPHSVIDSLHQKRLELARRAQETNKTDAMNDYIGDYATYRVATESQEAKTPWMLDLNIKRYIKHLSSQYSNLFFRPLKADNVAFMPHYILGEKKNNTQLKLETSILNDIKEQRGNATSNIFAYPLHIHGNHWTLVLVDTSKKTVEYYDSLYSNTDAPKEIENIAQALSQQEGQTYTFQKLNSKTQNDGYNCGPWLLYFLEKRLEGSLDSPKSVIPLPPGAMDLYRVEMVEKMLYLNAAPRHTSKPS